MGEELGSDAVAPCLATYRAMSTVASSPSKQRAGAKQLLPKTRSRKVKANNLKLVVLTAT